MSRRNSSKKLYFIDHDFKELSSIWTEEQMQSDIEFDNIEWIRVGKIPTLSDDDGANNLFEGDCTPNDISIQPEREDFPGLKFANTNLLSSMSVLAERSDLIKRIFVDQEIKKNAKYNINIYNKGVKEVVTVDDHLPCYEGIPMFADSPDY